MDEFEQIAADLEKSMKVDETAGPLSAEAKELLKDPANVSKALAMGAAALLKAKGAQTTDLSQEKKVKDDTVTDEGPDPAKSPKKSGQGYKDTRPYVGKGEDDADDDGDDDKPAFFGKKKKMKGGKDKPVKKSEDDSDDDDLVDVSDQIVAIGEHNAEVAKALNFLVGEVCELRKGHAELLEGTGIFGQVLHQVAEDDPRRDNLLVTMAKALNKALTEIADLKKGMAVNADLFKAISEMPGVPRAAGLALIKSEGETADATAGAAGGESKVSEGDRSRLFQAAVKKSITQGEYRHALKTGDVTILTKIAK